jgi:hypothetical protein
MGSPAKKTKHPGRGLTLLLGLLLGVPLAGLLIHQWLASSRTVEQAEMVGVWRLQPERTVAPQGLKDGAIARLTNQWLALGSKGTCWFHAPSPSSPWRGQATWDEMMRYGETLSPVQWPGGPPAAAVAPATNEPPRRKPREIALPVLRWTYHTGAAGSRAKARAQVTVERDGQIDGNITIEAVRDSSGQVSLQIYYRPPEGAAELWFEKSDALDIDSPPAAGT